MSGVPIERDMRSGGAVDLPVGVGIAEDRVVCPVSERGPWSARRSRDPVWRRFTALASLLLCAVLATSSARAETLIGWQAAQIGPMAYVTEVAIVGGDRFFSGYTINPFTFAIDAKIYSTSGIPGSSVPVEMDLGIIGLTSVATSIAAKPGGTGYFATAQQNQLNGEIRSWIFDSLDLGSPTAIGPPALSPDVALYSVNKDGWAVGDQAGTIPVVAFPWGFGVVLPFASPASLSGIDSQGLWLAGESEPVPGEDRVALVAAGNTVVFEDDRPGLTWGIEAPYAVGSRDGIAVWWTNVGSTYVLREVRNSFGTPLAGALLTIDPDGHAFGGGYLDDGRAIVVDLQNGKWFDVEDELSLPTNTLRAIVGIDIDNGVMALAAEGMDLSGWEITAQVIPDAPVPGPGLLLAPALLAAAGWRLRRGPRSQEA